jgi:hypothetical protein
MIWSVLSLLVPVSGELRLCNGTRTPVVAAVAFHDQQDRWTTVGWIPLDAGHCDTLAEPDHSQSLHVFGKSVDGAYKWAGDRALCTHPFPFVIRDGQCAPADRQLFAPVARSSVPGRSTVTFHAQSSPGKGMPQDRKSITSPAKRNREEVELLRAALDRLLPTTLDETQDWITVGGIFVNYSVRRGPVRLVTEPGGFRGTVDVYYSGRGVLRAGPALVSIGSCGQEKPRIVQVAFRTRVSSIHNGSVNTKTTIESIDFINRCRPTVLRVDVTNQIERRLRTELAALAPVIDSALASAVEGGGLLPHNQ